MTIDLLLTAILLYAFFVVVMFQISKKHKIKSIYVLLLSIFFTPLAGLIAILMSEHGRLVIIERYACNRCGYEYTEERNECPHCLQDGESIKLRKVIHKSL